MVHEDAKVVSEVCACDSECPHGGEDKDVSGDEEGSGECFYGGDGEELVRGLVLECGVVEVVTEDAEGEDGQSEEVAAKVSVAVEDACNRLIPVLVLGDDVPEGGIEGDGGGCDPEGGLCEVDESGNIVRGFYCLWGCEEGRHVGRGLGVRIEAGGWMMEREEEMSCGVERRWEAGRMDRLRLSVMGAGVGRSPVTSKPCGLHLGEGERQKKEGERGRQVSQIASHSTLSHLFSSKKATHQRDDDAQDKQPINTQLTSRERGWRTRHPQQRPSYTRPSSPSRPSSHFRQTQPPGRHSSPTGPISSSSGPPLHAPSTSTPAAMSPRSCGSTRAYPDDSMQRPGLPSWPTWSQSPTQPGRRPLRPTSVAVQDQHQQQRQPRPRRSSSGASRRNGAILSTNGCVSVQRINHNPYLTKQASLFSAPSFFSHFPDSYPRSATRVNHAAFSPSLS